MDAPVTTAHQVTKVVSDAPQDANSQRIGVEFLVRTIANLESELRTARARANAWAIGDLDLLRAQMDADVSAASLYASSWPFLQGEGAAVADRANRWALARRGRVGAK